MPPRRHLRTLFTFCLLCLFSFQALAGSGVRLCQHARAAAPSPMHQAHQHHAGMAMQTIAHHDHHAAADLLQGCGCGCADRHCAASAPALSAAHPSAGIVALEGDAAAATIAATQLRDAHDRDLIRPPSVV